VKGSSLLSWFGVGSAGARKTGFEGAASLRITTPTDAQGLSLEAG
jgi:hypothetical protein